MAAIAPAYYTVELETTMTGWMSRRGVRFWLVTGLLMLARLLSRSKVTVQAKKTRENENLPSEYKNRLEEVASFPARCSHPFCPGVSECVMCPSRACARCKARGVKLNENEGIDLCDGCTDEVLRENGLDPETLEPLDKPCDRCNKPTVEQHEIDAGRKVCDSCWVDFQRSQRFILAS